MASLLKRRNKLNQSRFGRRKNWLKYIAILARMKNWDSLEDLIGQLEF